DQLSHSTPCTHANGATLCGQWAPTAPSTRRSTSASVAVTTIGPLIPKVQHIPVQRQHSMRTSRPSVLTTNYLCICCLAIGFKPEFSTSYYGEYQCSRGRCGRAWSSHQSWLGYQRQCPDCAKWTYPWLLRTHEWVGPDSLSTGNGIKRKARRSVGEHRSGFWARLWLIVAVVLVLAAVAAVVVATGAYDRLVPYVAPVVKDLMAKVDNIYANWGSD
ncbi:unnamed protein product, partial [Medioppia subpectinata]